MTIIFILLSGIAEGGVSGAFLALAMLCDTALLITAMVMGIIHA